MCEVTVRSDRDLQLPQGFYKNSLGLHQARLSLVVIEGVVVVWIPACAGMTRLR